ncbi:Sapep family Mn(2+)-dependent dipeptidase [Ileibacterium valens]|uniref:Peptidase M20 n=2 Tax=Ileibacterium valens TaxID=1862668 RepID=A0A1U7NDC8_9FIRM|nr:Sapep family Mn(2+)-dependent dipeptidase [Ileibacterium valens]OLU37005.1 hypothetical protein BO222_11295 [Ileibacterium valens]OLU39798.1 hypothetical protein BO224_06750 [Erysipelotrichaceae bacterium NYU-BL-E8]OLU40968.1 hypothetical protein BM735_04790 [Erysipelotrichaceae bacterium NYU-BL-F16]
MNGLNKEEQALLVKIQDQKDEMLQGIFEVVSIPSERQEPADHAPYGKPVKEALDHVMEMAREMGFATKVIEDQVGIVQYGGNIDDCDHYLGIMGHLDVVEAKNQEGWISDPYQPEIRDGKIYARGILDNKGPILSCLYALKALKDLNIEPALPIRILFGTNEETGMEDVPVYLANEAKPAAGFTPDCKYPVVYAERGRALYYIDFDSIQKTIDWVNTYFIANQSKEKAMNLEINDPEFGLLQIRNTKMTEHSVEFAISYPPCITADKILDIIQGISKNFEGKAVLVDDWKPVFFEKESALCKILQSSYEELTGLDGTPVPTTGGTYAKRLGGILPFGPSFPGQKGIAHLPNEWMDVNDLMKNAEIYALSLYRLSREDHWK